MTTVREKNKREPEAGKATKLVDPLVIADSKEDSDKTTAKFWHAYLDKRKVEGYFAYNPLEMRLPANKLAQMRDLARLFNGFVTDQRNRYANKACLICQPYQAVSVKMFNKRKILF